MLHLHSVEEFPGQADESAIGAPPLLGESIGIFSPRLLVPFMLLLGVLPFLQRQRVLKRVAGREYCVAIAPPIPSTATVRAAPPEINAAVTCASTSLPGRRAGYSTYASRSAKGGLSSMP